MASRGLAEHQRRQAIGETIAREPAGKGHLTCTRSGESFLGKRFLGVKRGGGAWAQSWDELKAYVKGSESGVRQGQGSVSGPGGSLVKEQACTSIGYHTAGRAGDE